MVSEMARWQEHMAITTEELCCSIEQVVCGGYQQFSVGSANCVVPFPRTALSSSPTIPFAPFHVPSPSAFPVRYVGTPPSDISFLQHGGSRCMVPWLCLWSHSYIPCSSPFSVGFLTHHLGNFPSCGTLLGALLGAPQPLPYARGACMHAWA